MPCKGMTENASRNRKIYRTCDKEMINGLLEKFGAV
jgi:hypothetical protein